MGLVATVTEEPHNFTDFCKKHFFAQVIVHYSGYYQLTEQRVEGTVVIHGPRLSSSVIFTCAFQGCLRYQHKPVDGEREITEEQCASDT